MRISGVNIPDEKRTDIALTYIYGIGRSNVADVLARAQVAATTRVKNLTEDEQKRLLDALSTLRLEGDLRAEEMLNIKRLKDIGSYRGSRHIHGLPTKGQRTRSNARTRRGKRMTIGAMKKEVLAKLEASQKQKEVTAAKASKK